MKMHMKIAAAVVMTTGMMLQGFAANTLSVVRSGRTTLQVRLENSSAISGMQFSLRVSSGLRLDEPQKTGRLSSSDWMISSYKPNDSTINVVIMNAQIADLGSGNGSIAEISFTEAATQSSYSARIEQADACDKNAVSVAMTAQPLTWNGSASIASAETKNFEFGQNYPNPFNPSTNLGYRLNTPAHVSLKVYDVAGREIATLVDADQFVGEFAMEWRSVDNSGTPVPSGVYFAKLQVGNNVETKKMMLTR